MNKVVLPSLISFLLLGCSSSVVPTKNPDLYTNYTGGQTMGDTTSFYWYTEKSSEPDSAADYVFSGHYGWYKSDYRWEGKEVREFIREGEQIKPDEGLVPYQIHVRFNKSGEAVYQQYRLDGKVLPLSTEQLERYQQEAKTLQQTTLAQDDTGMELLQGVWDGSSLELCSGQTYPRVEFNQTLPSFVINRLATIDSYVAFMGTLRSNRVVVEELLSLADEDHGCITRPELIENQ